MDMFRRGIADLVLDYNKIGRLHHERGYKLGAEEILVCEEASHELRLHAEFLNEARALVRWSFRTDEHDD